MIVVNFWLPKDHDRHTGEYEIHLAASINEGFDISRDSERITLAIDNDDDFKPKEETLYEIYLQRATIAGDRPGDAFSIVNTIELKPQGNGTWGAPLIQL